MKVAVLGLDCAAPHLVFDRWREELPHLRQLDSYPDRLTPIERAAINWSREPQGIVAPSAYEKVRSDLIAEIEAIEDTEGRNIGSRAYRPEGLYRECRGVPPDPMVYFGNLNWRSVGAVGLNTGTESSSCGGRRHVRSPRESFRGQGLRRGP